MTFLLPPGIKGLTTFAKCSFLDVWQSFNAPLIAKVNLIWYLQISIPEAYWEPCQASKMEHFVKTVNASVPSSLQNAPSQMFDRVLNAPLKSILKATLCQIIRIISKCCTHSCNKKGSLFGTWLFPVGELKTLLQSYANIANKT